MIRGISAGIADFIRGKRVVPPVPPGAVIVLEAEDVPARSMQRDETTSLALFIDYRDAKGAPSQRRIVCRSFDRSAGTLTAYCFEREAMREFRVDRMVTAACTETGELFDLDELLSRLNQRGLPVRDSGLNLTLRMLTFLMRCDGIDHREQIAIDDAITSYALRFDGDDQLVNIAMKQARTMAPDEADFARCLRAMRLRRDKVRLSSFIRQQAKKVIDADGRHSREEARFCIELDAVFGKIAAKN